MIWIFKNKKITSEKGAFILDGECDSIERTDNFVEGKIVSQGRKWRAFLFAFFVISLFSFFSGVAHAGYCYCAEYLGTTAAGSITLSNTRSVFNDIVSNAACNDKCFSVKDGTYYYYSETQDENYTKVDDLFVPSLSKAEYTRTHSNPANNAANQKSSEEIKKAIDDGQKDNTCSAGIFDAITSPAKAFKCMLIGVLQLLGKIFGVAASLFQWLVEPSNMSGPTGLLNKQPIKDVWIMVRDTLNMVFILVLLFSAFCTVFQVDKWSLKKVWLNILINALLVNFSFPIARIFIDISNVAMYYFLNHLFSGTGQGSGSAIMASFGDSSRLADLLTPKDYASQDLAYFFAAIVFTFILGITLLVLAGLFVVRLIWLSLLVMFSPIGFVANIFPGTSGYAGKWWDALFKYSFFGPVMAFMMMVSLQMIRALPDTFNSAASINTDTASSSAWIANAAFYFIPVAILWIAMGISQKMGIAGAGYVVGQGQKFAKKVGGWVGGLPMRGVKAGWKATGIPGGVKKGWENTRKTGKLFGKNVGILKDGREEREAGIAGVMKDGKGGWEKSKAKTHNTALDEDVKKAMENYDSETTSSLTRNLKNTVKINAAMKPENREEAVKFMAQYKQLQSDPIRKTEHEARIRNAAIRSAASEPHIINMTDPSLKQAAIEAHVQKKISEEWGTMKSNYQKVRNVHKL